MIAVLASMPGDGDRLLEEMLLERHTPDCYPQSRKLHFRALTLLCINRFSE
jgi:hypothetical protein